MRLAAIEHTATYDFDRADPASLPAWCYQRMLDAPAHAVLRVPPARLAWTAAWMARRRPDLAVVAYQSEPRGLTASE